MQSPTERPPRLVLVLDWDLDDALWRPSIADAARHQAITVARGHGYDVDPDAERLAQEIAAAVAADNTNPPPFGVHHDEVLPIDTSAPTARSARLTRLQTPPPNVILARIEQWTREYGWALIPTGTPDTFGEGMRAAKRQIAALLVPDCAEPNCPVGVPHSHSGAAARPRDHDDATEERLAHLEELEDTIETLRRELEPVDLVELGRVDLSLMIRAAASVLAKVPKRGT